MSVFYDVCKVFNEFEIFYGILEVSESQFFMTYARFSMISMHLMRFWERPKVTFS